MFGRSIDVVLVPVLLSFSVLGLRAQNESGSTVLAKAGLITLVEGAPSVTSSRQQNFGFKLLSAGDQIETQENDRMEIALNPGSYLRIGSGSRVEVIATALNGMHFRISQGNVIVDGSAFDPTHHVLHLSTPAGTLQLVKPGLYRNQCFASRTC